MKSKEKNYELLLVAAALTVTVGVLLYSVFDSPKYNDLQAFEITENQHSTTEISTEFIGKININTAGVEELMKLELIGEKKALAIIEYREQNGKFRKPEELMNIDGISDTIVRKNYDKITV